MAHPLHLMITVKNKRKDKMAYVNFNTQKAFKDIFTATQLNEKPTWKPSTDVYTTEEGVEVWIDLPGVPRSQLNIEVEDGVLKITGSKQSQLDSIESVFRERYQGDFERKFKLSRDLDSSKVEAVLSEGLLKVSIRKKTEFKPQKIEIH